ncbi:hypothetical protein L2E82_53736 [Cichorium intybus]|nr:hypothetical protein L2E82_53736 [Cichorium intybus]
MRDESSELLESWKIGISRLPILIPAFKVERAARKLDEEAKKAYLFSLVQGLFTSQVVSGSNPLLSGPRVQRPGASRILKFKCKSQPKNVSAPALYGFFASPYLAGGRFRKKSCFLGSRVPVPKRMGEFGLSVHRSGGSICSGVVRRGVAQSALPEGKREWPFLLPSVETEIEDWAFSLFYREAAGVNSVSSSSPWFEEFDDRPSLQKIPELVDSESAGLEESGATRIFNGFESLLIPGGRPNSMEFAISQACRLSKERPVRIFGMVGHNECSSVLPLLNSRALSFLSRSTSGTVKPLSQQVEKEIDRHIRHCPRMRLVVIYEIRLSPLLFDLLLGQVLQPSS